MLRGPSAPSRCALQEVVLQLLDIPQMQSCVAGVAMELEDCSFPLIKGALWPRRQCSSICNLPGVPLLGMGGCSRRVPPQLSAAAAAT